MYQGMVVQCVVKVGQVVYFEDLLYVVVFVVYQLVVGFIKFYFVIGVGVVVEFFF